MKFDFDKITDRRNTGSIKWNVDENILPMWIADMDFETAPCIRDAIKTKAELGIFGYEESPEEWYDAYINYWGKYHHLTFSKEDMCFSTGVIPIVSSAVRKLSSPGENVVIQTPVYNIFTNSIVNNGRNVLENPLIYKNGEYSIDFDDLELKLSNPQTTLMILCNPHNPVGKIWDKETLSEIGRLCSEYDVKVISDEIHCDIVAPGFEYIPFASASEICREISVTAIAPTKCFSIPGIQSACCVVFNQGLRNRMFKALNTDEVAEGNTFSYISAISAFKEGREWLDEMNSYVQGNREFVSSYLEKHIPSAKLVNGNATYLLWIDLSAFTDNTKDLCDFLKERTGLWVTAGSVYGKNGSAFIRMNVATQKTRVQDGLERLKKGIELYIK